MDRSYGTFSIYNHIHMYFLLMHMFVYSLGGALFDNNVSTYSNRNFPTAYLNPLHNFSKKIEQ